MSEKEPVFNIPPACAGLLLIILVVHLLQQFGGIDTESYSLQPLAFWQNPFSLHSLVTLFTYQFLHASWMHMGVNALMLLAFGSAMVRMTNGSFFILFYLFCGVIAAMAHILVYADQVGYLLGASGAVSGAMGFVLWLSIQNKKRQLQLLLLIVIIQPVLALASGDLLGGEIAWVAHVAGFIVGIVAAIVWRSKINQLRKNDF